MILLCIGEYKWLETSSRNPIAKSIVEELLQKYDHIKIVHKETK